MRTRKLVVSGALAAGLLLIPAGGALAHGGNFDRQGRVDPTLRNCVGLLNSMHAVDDGGIAHSIVVRDHPGFVPASTVQEWQIAVRRHCAQPE